MRERGRERERVRERVRERESAGEREREREKERVRARACMSACKHTYVFANTNICEQEGVQTHICLCLLYKTIKYTQV